MCDVDSVFSAAGSNVAITDSRRGSVHEDGVHTGLALDVAWRDRAVAAQNQCWRIVFIIEIANTGSDAHADAVQGYNRSWEGPEDGAIWGYVCTGSALNLDVFKEAYAVVLQLPSYNIVSQ